MKEKTITNDVEVTKLLLDENDKIVYLDMIKIVKPFGIYSAHVIIPKELLGKKVIISYKEGI